MRNPTLSRHPQGRIAGVVSPSQDSGLESRHSKPDLYRPVASPLNFALSIFSVTNEVEKMDMRTGAPGFNLGGAATPPYQIL